MVSVGKLSSGALLLIISYAMVAVVNGVEEMDLRVPHRSKPAALPELPAPRG